jgi:1-acyl-sn-glycerol-3-phosphate acyltransferase
MVEVFDFIAVERFGPTVAERVHGSAKLARRQRLARRVCHAMGRVEVVGLDRLPRSGPVVLAVNHQSFMDGALVVGFVGRVVSCIVKAEAFTPVGGRTGRVLIDGAQIPVRRGEIDPAPVRLCLQVLRAGGVIAVFPEGSRGDGRVRTARPGVGYFALKTAATVVPIAIHGSAAMTHRSGARRPLVRLIAGQPMTFGDATAGRPLSRGHWLAAAESIRVTLATLVSATEGLHSTSGAA